MTKASISASTRKKVILRRLDSGVIKGYVNSDSFLGPEGVEVLDREGHLLIVPLETIKGVYFVRDFEGNPDQPERRVVHNRLGLDGLRVRIKFVDNEVLEGLLANDLLAMQPPGFMVMPADFNSNNLRVFVPRNALASVEVLGVISDGTTRRGSRRPSRVSLKVPGRTTQIGLFQNSEESKSE